MRLYALNMQVVIKTYGENHSFKPFDIKKGCGGISSATPSLSNVCKTLLMAEIRRQIDINEWFSSPNKAS